MYAFFNKKISEKLMIGFVFIAVMTVAAGIAGIVMLQQAIASNIVQWTMGIIAGAVAVTAVILGVRMSRSIAKPLGKMVEAVNALAQGNIEADFDYKDNNEFGMLAASLQKTALNIRMNAQNLQMLADGNIDIQVAACSEKDIMGQSMRQTLETFRNLISKIEDMSARHNQGCLDVFIPVEDFEGAYRSMALGINNMMEGHITAIQKAMACVAEFGSGNFDAPLEQFQGEKAVINVTIEQFRIRLKALHEDINLMVESALEGNLAKRLDASGYEGDFKKIIEGINNLLNAVIQPIREAAHVMTDMAKGNLQLYVMGDYKGHHAQMKNAVNSTIDSFNKILAEIWLAADQVASGSEQVAAGNQAVSKGATEQASSIEELIVTIGNIAEQTRQNVEFANQSKESAQRSLQVAEDANEQMKGMLVSMQQINDSSASISKIIKVIDDIAFQTNILALNAAVEAARAGVHGKGFAVVAEEVRNLAQRSAQAAKETTDLIEGSVKKVNDGTKLADRTADALSQIMQVAVSAKLLEEKIVVASKEQSSAIMQLNQGIEQMSQVVQTNSATAQEGAAASEELSGQAEMLKQKLSMFKLGDNRSVIPDIMDAGISQKHALASNK